jgi:phage tail-like protein
MRGLVAGLPSPHPLGPALPALYQDDTFAQRFLAGLDEVVAPIYSTLDNFDAYLDPHLTPDDFLNWLAGWVGIALDESWDVERRRAIVARAVDLYRMRGTALGLAGQVEIQTGGTVEIVENGATGWSVDPGAGCRSPDPLVVVRVTVPDPKGVDAAARRRGRGAHRIEIVRAAGPPGDGLGRLVARPVPRDGGGRSPRGSVRRPRGRCGATQRPVAARRYRPCLRDNRSGPTPPPSPPTGLRMAHQAMDRVRAAGIARLPEPSELIACLVATFAARGSRSARNPSILCPTHP